MASNAPVLATDSARKDAKLRSLQVLRAKLCTIKAECTLLEQELTAEGVPVFSVQVVPPEVLSMIFKYYLTENPRLIRRLMIVCRRWYEIAIHDPTLWTRIEIKIGFEENELEKKCGIMASFMKACIKYSGSMLLDIDIDYVNLQPWREQIDATMSSALIKLFPNGNDNMMRKWVQSQDWYMFMQYCEEDPPLHYSHCTGLLYQLSGRGLGDRWGTLKLVLPDDDDLADEVLANLVAPRPNLHRLSIKGYNKHDSGKMYHRVPFTNLLSLESVAVTNVRALKLLKRPIRLRELKIYQSLDQESLATSNSFKDLRTLIFSPKWIYSSSDADPLSTLTLPNLEALHLLGPGSFGQLPRFDLPALQHLHLIRHPAKFFDQLPNVLTPHIHWSIILQDKDIVEVEAGEAAAKILKQYHLSKRMTVPFVFKHAILGAIGEMKRGGVVKLALEFVVFQNPAEQVEETIAVNTI